MEEITEQEAEKMIKEEKEKIKQIINKGGKVTDTIINKKDEEITMKKIEPVNGKDTSSRIIQNKNEITLNL